MDDGLKRNSVKNVVCTLGAWILMMGFFYGIVSAIGSITLWEWWHPFSGDPCYVRGWRLMFAVVGVCVIPGLWTSQTK